MSADERREQVIEAAVAEFAHGGYEGTSTAAIARRVGVSQPYLFRLFPTKHALFLAAVDRCFAVLTERLREAAGGRTGQPAIDAMITAYRDVLYDDPTILRLQLQIYAAALGDEEIRRVGHARFAALWKRLGDLSGEDPDEIMRFVAMGMLTNVLRAFDVPFDRDRRITGAGLAEWAREAARE